MKLAAIELVGMFLAFFILAAVFVIPVVLMILCIRALWLYIKTHARAQEVKKETAAVRKTLSETLKDHRTRCKMTQEFVAESLGVSRQAVSKWETGVSQSSRDEQLTLTFFPSIVQQQDRRAGTIPARRSCHVCRSEKTGG